MVALIIAITPEIMPITSAPDISLVPAANTVRLSAWLGIVKPVTY